METVATMIEAQRHQMIPYRRRNFESNAMVAEILDRNGLHSVTSLATPAGDLLRSQSVPVGVDSSQSVEMSSDPPVQRAPTAPAALTQVYVAIVHSSPAGDSAAVSLAERTASPWTVCRRHGIGSGRATAASCLNRWRFGGREGARASTACRNGLQKRLAERKAASERTATVDALTKDGDKGAAAGRM